MIAHYKLEVPSVGTYFGTSQDLVIDNIGLTFDTSSIYVPAGITGTFQVVYDIFGSIAQTVEFPTLLPSTGTGIYNPWVDNITAYLNNSGTSSKVFIGVSIWIISSNTSGVSLQFGFGTLPTGIASGDIIVTQINSAFI